MGYGQHLAAVCVFVPVPSCENQGLFAGDRYVGGDW